MAFKRIDTPIDLFSSDVRKPKYGWIQDSILNHISEGNWVPGDRIPPERELARMFAASVGTVRNALHSLVNQGYLSREQGRGTFVRKSIEHTDALRYFRFVNSFDDQVPPLTIKCLQPPRLKTHHQAASFLGQALDTEVFEIVRLFLLDTQPLVYVTSYLTQNLFCDLDKFTFRDIEKAPIYQLVEHEYNLPTLAIRERFSATGASVETAPFLKVEPGTPVQKIMMVAVTMRNTVYAYQVSYCNTTERQIYREFPGQPASADL